MKTLIYLLQKPRKADRPLWCSGIGYFFLAILFLAFLSIDQRHLLGINLWIKPFKFAISIGIYSLSWALILPYLPERKIKKYFIWFTISAMGFEMLAIATQAARGELSHFNISGTYNQIVYALMGMIITMQTIFSLYIGLIFIINKESELSEAMLWAVRLGIIISSIFALSGGLMGQRMAHTVGAADGGTGIAFFNWSRSYGDLRIAHFFGLHALQILPAYAWIGKVKRRAPVILFGTLYFLLVSFLFYHSLLGKAY